MPKRKAKKVISKPLNLEFRPLVEQCKPTENTGRFFKGIALRMIDYGFLSKKWLYSFGEPLSLHDHEIDLLFQQLVKKDYAEIQEKGFVLLQTCKEFYEDYDRRICVQCFVVFSPDLLKWDITEFHDPFYKAQHVLGVCSRQCYLFVKQKMPLKEKRTILKQQKLVECFSNA